MPKAIPEEEKEARLEKRSNENEKIRSICDFLIFDIETISKFTGISESDIRKEVSLIRDGVTNKYSDDLVNAICAGPLAGNLGVYYLSGLVSCRFYRDSWMIECGTSWLKWFFKFHKVWVKPTQTYSLYDDKWVGEDGLPKATSKDSRAKKWRGINKQQAPPPVSKPPKLTSVSVEPDAKAAAERIKRGEAFRKEEAERVKETEELMIYAER